MLASPTSLLQRRGPILWFRKAIPADLTDRLGCSDIRRSLRTSNARVARQRAWSLVLVIEDAFETLRRSGIPPEARSVIARIIDTVIDDFDRDGRQPATRAKYRILIESLAAGNEHRSIADIAGAQPSLTNTLIDMPMKETPVAAPEPQVAPAPIDIAGMIREAVTNAVREANISPAAKQLLSAVLPSYLSHKNEELKGNKHFDEISSKLTIFLLTAGDKPIHAYTQQDMRAYRDLIDQMPARATQYFKTDDPAIVIPLNRARRTPLPAISPTTVNAKYLSAVRGLFQYLVKEKIIRDNPLDGVQSGQDPGDLLPVEQRLPFTKQQIAALQRVAKTKPKWSADRWWINLMYKAGLRDEELAELSVADFRVLNGRICIDLLHTDDGDPINRERRRLLRIKTPAGRRIIPLTQSLLDDGIMDLVEKRRRESGPQAMLFPQLKANKYGTLSSALSKRLNRQVDKVIVDPRYVAYSARHSFAAACDAAGVPEELRDRFMGHEPNKDGKEKKGRGQHVRERYGSPILSAEEMAWIDKLSL